MNKIQNFLILTVLILTISACKEEDNPQSTYDGEVRVGILHSRTGSLAISENTVAEAELLAIAEINADGGLLIDGKRMRIITIEEDGMSDRLRFANMAAKLIDIDKVQVIFGGWTSSSRKAMLPIVEAREHLLFYPLQYEGEECSKNILYAGLTPNQQVLPAIDWLLRKKGDHFFLVGSDYVYPRTVNKIITNQVLQSRGLIVSERYVPLGDQSLSETVQAIKSALPAGGVVINTINGDSNVAFFQEATAQGVTRDNGYTIISFSVSEEEVEAIGAEYLEGSFATWSFFESIDTPASNKFTRSFKTMYGVHRVTTDPAESAYSMVHLWAAAAVNAGSTRPDRVRSALIGSKFDAPHGRVEVAANHHLNKSVFIGEVQANGQFNIVKEVGIVAPIAWSQLLPENKGFSCDWSRKSKDAGRFQAIEPNRVSQ
jgi:urea transport system substrate-binding protein